MSDAPGKKKEEKDKKGLALPWAEGASGAAKPSLLRQFSSPFENLFAFLKTLPGLGPAGALKALGAAGGKGLLFLLPFIAAGYFALHYADRLTKPRHKSRSAFGPRQTSAADAEKAITNEGLGVAGVYTKAKDGQVEGSPLPIPEGTGEGEQPAAGAEPGAVAGAPAAAPGAQAAGAAPDPVAQFGQARPDVGKLQKMVSFSEQSGGSSQASFGSASGSGGQDSRASGRSGSASGGGGAGGKASGLASGRARIGKGGGRGSVGTERKAVSQLMSARRLSQQGTAGSTEHGKTFAAAAFDGQAITGAGASIGAAGVGSMGGAGGGAGGGGMGAGAGGGDAMEDMLGQTGGGAGGDCNMDKQKKLRDDLEEKDVTPYQEDLDRARDLGASALSKRRQAFYAILGGLAAIIIGLRMLGRAVKAGKTMAESTFHATKAATLGAGALAGTVGLLKAKGATPRLGQTQPRNGEKDEKEEEQEAES